MKINYSALDVLNLFINDNKDAKPLTPHRSKPRKQNKYNRRPEQNITTL